MKYALVLVNIKGLGVKTFSYLIPEEMKDEIQIGQAVLVPFGRQGLQNAFIVGFSDYISGDFKVKKINRIIDKTPLFSLKYLKLLEWVANYYCCDFVTVLNAALPMKLIDKNSKTELSIEATSNKEISNLTKRQQEIIALLKEKGKCSIIEFEEIAKTTRATLKKLAEGGFVKIKEEYVYRNPLSIFKDIEIEPLYELQGEQIEAYEGIKAKLRSPNPILLHGVTASGKTEVYFSCDIFVTFAFA